MPAPTAGRHVLLTLIACTNSHRLLFYDFSPCALLLLVVLLILSRGCPRCAQEDPRLLCVVVLSFSAMSSFLVTALLALFSARLVASQDQQTTWGTVILSLNGERTPEIAVAFPYLTPLGAQQAFAAGSAIRTRYIEGPGTNITNSYPIPGLSVNAIDNTQLYLLARDDDYIAGSAQAFMQGVYPPLGSAHVDEESILSNGTLVQYPLGGYQYPTIDTISPLDFNYVW